MRGNGLKRKEKSFRLGRRKVLYMRRGKQWSRLSREVFAVYAWRISGLQWRKSSETWSELRADPALIQRLDCRTGVLSNLSYPRILPKHPVNKSPCLSSPGQFCAIPQENYFHFCHFNLHVKLMECSNMDKLLLFCQLLCYPFY